MTPKSDHEEEMSMEEILASIRKFVTDNPGNNPGESAHTPSRGATRKDYKPQSVPQNHQDYQGVLENSVPMAPPLTPVGQDSFPAMTPEHHHAVLRSTMHADTALQRAEPAYDPSILELTDSISATQQTLPQNSAWTPPSRTPLQKKTLEESIMTLTNPIDVKKPENPLRAAMKSSPAAEPEENLGSSHTMVASASSLSRLAQASKTAAKRAPNLADQRGVTLDQLIQEMIRPMIKQWIDTHLPTLVEEMVAKEIKRITKHLG